METERLENERKTVVFICYKIELSVKLVMVLGWVEWRVQVVGEIGRERFGGF